MDFAPCENSEIEGHSQTIAWTIRRLCDEQEVVFFIVRNWENRKSRSQIAVISCASVSNVSFASQTAMGFLERMAIYPKNAIACVPPNRNRNRETVKAESHLAHTQISNALCSEGSDSQGPGGGGYSSPSLREDDQRAANGGSDPSWLNLAFLGRPDFPSRGPQTLKK